LNSIHITFEAQNHVSFSIYKCITAKMSKTFHILSEILEFSY